MAVRIESSAEPIPGYKLLDRLGSGGFGEVWKCEAPGGIFKAIKIVHGDLRGKDNDLVRYAEQELKALKRVKMVRHPYLLALDRYDIVDGRLLITMELADCNLWDRFRDCRDKNLPGIPRDELLLYMSETAEVLDLMNDQHQLQHLDIKPQNLFMLHNHVKVADFGQVKDLENFAASVTGGITPVYAAPETFDGVVSKYCDQYSLACVYQELLTGQRPFDGTSMSQLLMQHIQLAPDLSPSPACDRPALARALAKKPSDRWPTATAFVKALRDAGGPRPSFNEAPTVFPQHETRAEMAANTPSVPAETPMPVAEELDAGPVFTPAPPEISGPGVLQPVLLIGLGQTGLRVLQRFRHETTELFGPPEGTPLIRTVYIDTDPDSLDDAAYARPMERLAALSPNEVLPAKLNRAGHYLKPRFNGRSLTEGWFDAQLLYKLPRTPQTMGLRLFGRLAFCDHYRAISGKIQVELESALATESLLITERRTGLERRTNRPRVVVVAGLSGGTGGGMFLDVAYAVRTRLQRMGYEFPDVVGLLVAPPADPTLTPTQALGNAYAALTELNHYSRPETVFTANYDDRHGVIREKAAPFTRVYLMPGTAPGSNPTRTTPPGGIRGRTPPSIPTPRARVGPGSGATVKPGSRSIPASASQRTPDPGAAHAALKPFGDAAEFLRVTLFTGLGRVVDEQRHAEEHQRAVTFSTFGISAFDWPRVEVVGRTATTVAQAILKDWASPNLKRAREVVPGWAAARWTQHGLDPDGVVSHLHQAADQAAGGRIEELIGLTTEPLAPRGWLARLPEPARVAVALDKMVTLLGPPASGNKRAPTPVEDALAHAAGEAGMAFALDLRTLGPELVENPTFRLSGAEEVLRQLLATTDRLIDHYQQAVTDHDAKGQAAYDCVMQYAHFQKGMRKPSAGEFADAIRQFPRYRFQAITARHVIAVYQVVRDELANQLGDIGTCRQRVEDAADLGGPVDLAELPLTGRRLLPAGCTDVADAVRRFTQILTDTDMEEIDRRVQSAVEPEAGGLYQVCLNTATGAERLVAIVREEARAYLDRRLGEVDLAAMFAERFRTPQAAERAIEQAYQDAEPAWVGNGPWAREELVAASVPEGGPLRDLAQRAIPVAGLPIADSRDDVTIYREYPSVPVSVLPHFGPAALAAYQSLPEANQCSAHARLDVTAWFDIDSQ
jgi:hypothetical protein